MKFPLRFVTTKNAAAPVGDEGVSSLTFRSATSSTRSNLYNLLTIRLSKTKLAATPSKAPAAVKTTQGSTTSGQIMSSSPLRTIPILPLLQPSGRRESTGDDGAIVRAEASQRRQSGDCITIPEEEIQEILEAEVTNIVESSSSHPRFVYSVNDPVDLFTSSLTFHPAGEASGHL